MNRSQRFVVELIAIQAGLVVVIAGLWLLANVNNAIAALVGGFITLIINSTFAWCLFHKMEQRTGTQILLTLYIGEVFKIIACAVGAGLALRFLHLAMLPLLTGLAGTYIIYAPVAIYRQLRMVKI